MTPYIVVYIIAKTIKLFKGGFVLATHLTPEQSIGFRYGGIFRKITNLFAIRLKPYGITPEQWTVLYQVTLHEGVNQKEVSVRSDKDQPTVTRILDVLDKKNLILRKPDPADRRAFLIYATPEAKELIAETIPLETSLNTELTAGLSLEQLEAFDAVMAQISSNIEKSYQN